MVPSKYSYTFVSEKSKLQCLQNNLYMDVQLIYIWGISWLPQIIKYNLDQIIKYNLDGSYSEFQMQVLV